MKIKLKECVQLVKDRTSIENVDLASYISTDNMLPNRKGVDFNKSSKPKAKTVLMYQKGDVLISNIRPYFKKIWMADRNGTRSGDILAFRVNKSGILQKYLYCILQSDIFFDYVMASAKGTKMPRGDKNAILDFEFEVPSIEKQKKVYKPILTIEKKINLNNKINTNLFNLMSITFENLYTSNRYNKKFTLNELVSETLTGEWGKEKIIDSFNKKATIIRGADFLDVSKGLKGNTPVRYLKANAYDKKFLQANDVLVEISGGSPTQSTGRSLLITTQVLAHFTTKTFGTNFTRNFRLKTSEDAILFKSYIQFLYDKKLFFNYENGTTGIKNLDYKSVLKIPLPDFRDTCDFQYYLKSYTKYYSLIQQLGLENNKLLKIKNILLQKYF